jgi:anti-sigma factor RsiW
MHEPISEFDVHAFIDGELSPQRAAEVEAAMERDPELAARIRGFQADKRALIAAWQPLGDAPVPARLMSAARRRPSPFANKWVRRVALAGVTALAAGLLLTLVPRTPPESAVDQALAARQNARKPTRELSGSEQANVEATGRAMSDMLGNPTRVPDLRRAGFNLVSAEIYGDAVQLRYEDAERRLFTVYLRPSAGPDAFEVTERGPVRICVWQNADVTAVMTGALSTPELFRLASLAYSSLGL